MKHDAHRLPAEPAAAPDPTDTTLERTPDRAPDAPLDAIARILEAQIEHHRALRALIERKREAIRTADIDAITGLCQRENERAQRLGDLEKQRLEVVGHLTHRFRPDAAKPLTLREIADHAPGMRRTELRLLADTLRAEIEAVRRSSSVVRAAAEALSRHMSGVMQTVTGAISRVHVYERRGRLAAGAQTQNCVDVTS